MTIKIVTDSTSDLPLEYLEKFDISLIPLYINFKDRGYIDGVEITRQEFYEMLPDQEIPPTTATPSIEAVLDLYQKLADEGADQFICLQIPLMMLTSFAFNCILVPNCLILFIQ
jgi:DegV family protein with EDD domain